MHPEQLMERIVRLVLHERLLQSEALSVGQVFYFSGHMSLRSCSSY